MNTVRRIFLAYSAGLFAVSVGGLTLLTAWYGLGTLTVPGFLGFTLYTLLAISLGFRVPTGNGHTSLDRTVQIAAILIYGPLAAAWVTVVSSAAWPLIRMRANGDSISRALARSFHNSGMLNLVVLAGGYTYLQTGGPIPLTGLDLMDIGRLALSLVVMQAVNEFLMRLAFRVNDPDSRPSFSLFNAVLETAAAPVGVFAALVYARMEFTAFVLFVGLFTVLAWLIRSFADLRRDLEKRLEAMFAINRVGQAVSGSLILDDLVEMIFRECRNLIDFSSFYLVLYDAEREELDFRVHFSQGRRMPRSSRKLGTGLLGWIVDNNQQVLIQDWDQVPDEIRDVVLIVGERPKSFIGVPVSYKGQVLGVISVQNYAGHVFGQAELQLMQTFADQAAAAIANARLFAELDHYKGQLEEKVEARTEELERRSRELHDLSEHLRQANTQKEHLLDELQRKTDELDRQTKEDSLTGLYNRRYIDAFMVNELKRSQRFGHRLSVAMADLDHFKVINDRYSHGIGDQVLRTVARILKDGCRGIDVIGRYGGEEFVLIFPETPVENARMACEKLRESIEAYDWLALHPELNVTISIGIASDRDGEGAQAILAAADEKLYQAKRAGRNRVIA